MNQLKTSMHGFFIYFNFNFKSKLEMKVPNPFSSLLYFVLTFTALGGAGVVGCALVDLLAKAFAGSDLLGLGLGSNANNLNNLIGGSVGN